jgi:hypothetical protein
MDTPVVANGRTCSLMHAADGRAELLLYKSSKLHIHHTQDIHKVIKRRAYTDLDLDGGREHGARGRLVWPESEQSQRLGSAALSLQPLADGLHAQSINLAVC